MAHRKRKAQEMSESSSSSSDEDVEMEQVQESEKQVESSSDSEGEEQEEEKEVADSSDSEEDVAEREEEQVDDSSDDEEEEVKAEEVEAESSESEEEEVQKKADSSDSEEEEEKAEEEVESSDSEEEKPKEEVAESSESEEEQVQVQDNSDSEDEEEQVQDSSDSEEEETKEEAADSSESEKEEENSSSSSDESEHEEAKEKIITQRQPVKVTPPTEKRQPVKVMQPMQQKKLVAVAPSKEQKSSSAAESPTKKQKVEPQSAPVKLTHKEIQLKALHRVLEPFTKYQMLEILSNAAMQHKNLYDDLKTMLGSDLVHRKVFVRGLSPTTTTKALREKYSAFGKVEDAVINKDKLGKSLSDGFVTFSDMEAAQRAVENQLVIVIDGRTPSCHLKDSRDKSEAPPLSDDEIKRRVFVRGLCETTTSYTLHQEFKRFGELERVFVPRNPETKTNKGYGFVVFREETGAKSALEVSEKTIDGRQVKCVPYAGHDKPEFSKPPEPPLGKRQGPPSRFSQNPPSVQKGARDRKLYFSGDFKRLKHDSLRREFEKFGKVMNFVVPADGAKTGEGKGAGVVVYRDEAETKSALKVQKKTVNGYLVRCWKPSIKSAKKKNKLALKAIKAKKKSKRADKDNTKPN